MKPIVIKAQIVEREVDFSLWQSDASLSLIPTELFNQSVAVHNSSSLEGFSHHSDMTVKEIVPESNEVYIHFFCRKDERIFRFLLARSFGGIEITVYGLQENHAGQVERGNFEVMTMIHAALASQTWGENLFDVISVGQYFPIPLEGDHEWLMRFLDLTIDETPEGMVLMPGRSAPLIQSSSHLARLSFRRFLAFFTNGMNIGDFPSQTSLAFAMEIAIQYYKVLGDSRLLEELNQMARESGDSSKDLFDLQTL